MSLLDRVAGGSLLGKPEPVMTNADGESAASLKQTHTRQQSPCSERIPA